MQAARPQVFGLLIQIIGNLRQLSDGVIGKDKLDVYKRQWQFRHIFDTA